MCLTAIVLRPGKSALLLARPTFIPVAWIGPQSRHCPPMSRIWRMYVDFGIRSLARSTPWIARVLPSSSAASPSDDGYPDGGEGDGWCCGCGYDGGGTTLEGVFHPPEGGPGACEYDCGCGC